ncbi:LexA family transcriptional regulator [Aliarcobacter butzleri]|jgi:phage repressor protein C with HTH and peptisase S24 domain|uniref:LexA family transcriptional regulator n=1 Tax=Aliarcobacter butzleri TaxID=28197 RepID=UPI003AF85F52
MNRVEEILSRIYDYMGIVKDLEFCEKFEIKPNTLSTWKKRNTIPYELIEKISQNEKLSLDFLLLGKNNLNDKENKQENYHIDLLNVRAGAGEGIYNYVIETVDTISLDKSFFRTPINTNKIKGIQVDGDSMEPTLRDGDYVLIDENINFGTNGIYAIQYGGQILIKRLQFKMDGTILIISDNNKYDREVFNPKENQLPFKVLGIKILSIQK